MIRIIVALSIVGVAAIIAAVIPDARIAVILISGTAAVAVTATTPVERPAPAERPPILPVATSERAVIDAIAEPVLLVVDGRVRIANAAALALLGTHILGEDVRLRRRSTGRRSAARARSSAS